MLREVAGIPRPVSITFEMVMVFGRGFGKKFHPFFKKDKEKDIKKIKEIYRSANLTSLPGKLMQCIIPEASSKHKKDKKEICHS